jgi:hypothetical protein
MKPVVKFIIGKHLSAKFPFQNCLKQGDALSPLLFSFAFEYAIGDCLCGLVVRVPGYRSRGLDLIPSATKFSEK